ncbi:MAG: RdgB/HAM1 family non-canonical purine NTP pyrophosphatase [Muribaculaceae bacterium]|nr:RdgB/HAM1 family non-canonical purine NTP pyrophosphatase [Muribaculaceae bacterium]
MIVFATNNAHKLSEIRRILGESAHVQSLSDIGYNDDIPETATTLEGNAEIKARYVAENYGASLVFADDTGLEVEALGGEPGVYSARYAGPGHDSEANMRKLLDKMEGVTDRRARFRTVIALLRNGEVTFVEGEVRGTITTAPAGTDGFGYDPIFKPEGHDCTFAQMDADAKNAISHRGRAMARLMEVLNSNLDQI